MNIHDIEPIPKENEANVKEEKESLLLEGTFKDISPWRRKILLYLNTNFWGKFVIITWNEVRFRGNIYYSNAKY
jgi:hypothetical protein